MAARVTIGIMTRVVAAISENIKRIEQKVGMSLAACGGGVAQRHGAKAHHQRVSMARRK